MNLCYVRQYTFSELLHQAMATNMLYKNTENVVLRRNSFFAILKTVREMNYVISLLTPA